MTKKRDLLPYAANLTGATAAVYIASGALLRLAAQAFVRVFHAQATLENPIGVPESVIALLSLAVSALSLLAAIRFARSFGRPDFPMKLCFDDPRDRIVEQIKRLIIELVHSDGPRLHTNLSQHLAAACHHDYSALSKLFSETQGTTIEKYCIAQKIERAKELLDYGELSLGEIADRLDYSSTAHLSAQFKALTGLTPRQYKQKKSLPRIPLDKI